MKNGNIEAERRATLISSQRSAVKKLKYDFKYFRAQLKVINDLRIQNKFEFTEYIRS